MDKLAFCCTVYHFLKQFVTSKLLSQTTANLALYFAFISVRAEMLFHTCK